MVRRYQLIETSLNTEETDNGYVTLWEGDDKILLVTNDGDKLMKKIKEIAPKWKKGNVRRTQ